MSYPATISVRRPKRLDSWRPVGQWFLAIPHFIIVNALQSVSVAIAAVSWFVIMFTGKLPPGLANFQIMILRYTYRVELYAAFTYDEYPTFDYQMTAADPGGSPVIVHIRPVLFGRNRATVAFRLILIIPAFFYAVLIGIVGIFAWFLALFAVLFSGRWPDPLWEWVMRMQRVSIRFEAYLLLLTDEYPPFSHGS